MNPSAEQEFEEALFTAIVSAIEEVAGENVCALSLFVWGEQWGNWLPALNLGYNTLPHLAVKMLESRPFDPSRRRESLSLYDGTAVNEDEARWNLAHFKNQWLRQFRDDDAAADPVLLAARERWAAECDLDETRIWNAFTGLVSRLAHRLHAESHLTRVLGRPVPVIVCFEDDFEDAERLGVEVSELVNPPELIAGYRQWRLGEVG